MKEASKRDLRNFGLILGIILLVVGTRLLFKSRRIGLVFVILGVVFSSAGFLAPITLTYVYKPWMKVAHIIGLINTKVLFCIVYYLLVVPMGLAIRLMGKDLLGLKIDKHANSYWIRRVCKVSDVKQYEKQF